MNQEMIDLLQEIQEYMIENDCECGEWGGNLYNRIDDILEKAGVKDE